MLNYSFSGKKKTHNFVIKAELEVKTDYDTTTFTNTSNHFRGNPTDIFATLKASLGINRICFEQDCEPCWTHRDVRVKEWCNKNKVEWVERVGHTLWNPKHVSTRR